MSKIAVVYWSSTGNTEEMANQIAAGAKEAGNEVTVYPVSEFSSDLISQYDKIAFGCSAMGDEALDDSEFEPVFSECLDQLAGKDVVLFGSYDWGDGQWMRTWEETCNEANVNLVQPSLIINLTPDDEGVAKCQALGKSL